VSDDAEIAAAADKVKAEWGLVDVLVHSIAYANREDLRGRFIDTSRAGVAQALAG
jgi:enoyl-[acyl-carrier protein] reductase I